MNQDKYFWVIGGGLLQVPLIDEVRKFDLKVIVSDLSENCACAPLADVFFKIDIFDIEGHVREALKFTKQGRKIVGILAAGIDAPESMSAVAEALGLPAVQSSIANLVHNKHVFRQRLTELGYPMPKFRTVTSKTVDQVPAIVEEIGFPLIVKNSDSSGSRGTKIFYKPDLPGIQEMIGEAIKVSKSAVALIEECWEGPEQTVETLFDVDGQFHPCFITDRIFDRSSGYAIELGLRTPSTLPQSVQNEMFEVAKNISRDLGITIGASKFDMILTKKGPRVIEMTVRLSGGFDCQYLVPAATGKNVMRAAILTALGEKFPQDLLKDTKHRVGLSESIWPEPGKITSIAGIEEAKKIDGVEHIFFRQEVGDIVLPYTDCTKRVCFLIITGKDEAEANRTMEKVRHTIQIKTEKVA